MKLKLFLALAFSVAIGKGDLVGAHPEALTDIDGEPRSGTVIEVGGPSATLLLQGYGRRGQ